MVSIKSLDEINLQTELDPLLSRLDHRESLTEPEVKMIIGQANDKLLQAKKILSQYQKLIAQANNRLSRYQKLVQDYSTFIKQLRKEYSTENNN